MRRLPAGGLSVHRPRRYVRPSTDPQDDQGSVEETPATPARETVPDDLTTISALLDWVNGDADRAQSVLNQENSKEEKHRRKSLLQQLTDIILEA